MRKISTTMLVVLFTAGAVLLVSVFNSSPQNIEAQFSNVSNQFVNLTDVNHKWKPFSSTNVSQINGNLTIEVITDKLEKTFNRAYLQTKINSSVSAPTFLTFDYASRHLLYPSSSKPFFVIEIRKDNGGDILWTSFLNDTSGKLVNESFLLPSNILNIPIEFRLYIITQGGSSHSILSLKSVQISENNAESIAQLLNNTLSANFDLRVEGKTYPLRYDIQGAKIVDFNADQAQGRLDVNIKSNTNGILVVEVPRSLIDAKNQTSDRAYTVLVDNQNAVAHEMQASQLTRVLAVEFKQGNKLIEVIGTPKANAK